MGRPGPPPKPTALRIIEGNPARRPLNRDEPQPTQGEPSRPRWLEPEAKREWRRIVPQLRQLGLLTIVDRAALAAYCQSWARWRAAEAVRSAKGDTCRTPSGYIQQRPEVNIAHKERLLCLRFLAEFGLSPASRSRLHVGPPPQEVDEFEEFLKGG